MAVHRPVVKKEVPQVRFFTNRTEYQARCDLLALCLPEDRGTGDLDILKIPRIISGTTISFHGLHSLEGQIVIQKFFR